MKKWITLYSMLVFFSSDAISQVPQAISYQAVARNAAGNPLLNQPIGLQLSIQDSSGSNVYYVETHGSTTNQFGLFTVKIGMGTAVSGQFSSIPWSAGNLWLKVEMNPNASGPPYIIIGQSQLLSVPYALYANQVVTSGSNTQTMIYTIDGF